MTSTPPLVTGELPATGRQLQSTLRGDGTTELVVREVPVRPPGEGEVAVRVEAAPINPSDIGVMWPAGHRSGFRRHDHALIGPAAPFIDAHTGRVDVEIAPGNEGAGRVVATGASPDATELLGRTVAVRSGAGMFGDYVTVTVDQCLPMHANTNPERAASSFVNPLTAIGIITTARNLGRRAIIHTAAASSLGLMLNRLARADGIDIVNVVRRPEHSELLRTVGAEHVVDSSSDTYRDDLIAAVTATGATIAFDAIGGGRIVGELLDAIETAQRAGATYQRYGSNVDKRVFVYGNLDPSPTVIDRTFGLTWNVGGWYLANFLDTLTHDERAAINRRIADEIDGIFATTHTDTISLDDLLDPDITERYSRMATGTRYLVRPHHPHTESDTVT